MNEAGHQGQHTPLRLHAIPQNRKLNIPAIPQETPLRTFSEKWEWTPPTSHG